MASYFRASNAQVILDFGFTKFMPIAEVPAVHDYGFETQRAHPDVILGHWLHIQPATGAEGVRELRRCIDQAPGFIGFAVSGSGSGPPSDPKWFPFYYLCIEAGIPALIFVGSTGLGAGLPGGNGILLDDCHPRHLDYVAAKYPGLTIVAARPGWPWQSETIAVLMHKRNIWYELHGWSPKYFTPDLKHEIPRRLKDRLMFGADYPLFTYERLLRDWRELGYDDDTLDAVFHRNAERFLQQVARR
jgi:predicted TIM-barrel fold metal-dependent hydrolase